MIALQVSLYPLGKDDLKEYIEKFWQVLKKEKINFRITPLSTITWGDDEDKLYHSVFKAYKKIRKECHAVMVSTITTGTKCEIMELLGFSFIDYNQKNTDKDLK